MEIEEVQNNLEEAIKDRRAEQSRIEDKLTNDIKDLKQDILVIHEKTDQNCKDISNGFSKNALDHEELLQGIRKLEPLISLADEDTIRMLKEGVELKKSVSNIQNSILKNKWLKIVGYVGGIISVAIGLYLTIKYEIFLKR